MSAFRRLIIGILAFMASSAAAAPATLVYCSEGSPENFTPALNTTFTSLDAARPVFNQLIEFEPGTTNLVPSLAESWEISTDGIAITFHLRKGVKFHTHGGFKPTRDFNADDVLFSFNRQWKNDHPYHNVSNGSYSYFSEMNMPKLLKAIEKLDDYTVKMTLTESYAPILADLAMDFASIESAEYADFLMRTGSPEKFDQEPVGTGPFQFDSYKRDAIIRFKAFDLYWRGRPNLDELIYAITPDWSNRLARLQKGECQIMAYPNPADLAVIKQDGNAKLLSQPGLNIGYLAFNVSKFPLDRTEVRHALAMAINRQAILKEVYQQPGEPAKNLIPRTIWGYNDKVKDYQFDPEKAKALLASAGMKVPFDIDLWYMPVRRPYNPNGKRIAEMMQADLSRIGVNAKLVTYEWADYRKRLQIGDDDLTGQLGWVGDNGDPDDFFSLLSCAEAKSGGRNISKWCNKEFDGRLVSARGTFDKAIRAEWYGEMQQIVHDEIPILPIANSEEYDVISTKLSGYRQSPLGFHDFRDIRLIVLPDPLPAMHAEANIDDHRVAYVDAWPTSPGSMHVRVKLSNGWRWDPWWVTTTAHFFSGSQSYDMSFHAKCPASLGGHANECDYDFDKSTGIWPSFTKLTVEGHDWNGVGTRTPGTNDPAEVGVNVPIYSGNW